MPRFLDKDKHVTSETIWVSSQARTSRASAPWAAGTAASPTWLSPAQTAETSAELD